MYWPILNDAQKIRNGTIGYGKNSYDISKAAKDVADKSLQKTAENAKKQ